MINKMPKLIKTMMVRFISLLNEKRRIQLAKLLLEKDFDLLLKRRELTFEANSHVKEDQECLSTAIAEFDKYLNPSEVKIALDIGSRDARIALGLAAHYQRAMVYAFECNPKAIEICRKNIEAYEKETSDIRLVLVDKAISDVNGFIKFYPINAERTITPHADGNIGASSMFLASNQYTLEKYIQDEITVQSLTLNKWMQLNNIKEIDIIWMDLQGAELKALKGLKPFIDKVKLIYTEVNFKTIYQGSPLFEDLDKFLNNNHFLLVGKFNCSEWFGDALYVRSDVLGQDSPFLSSAGRENFQAPDSDKGATSYRPKSRLGKIPERSLIIEVKDGGLGDHLFWSHVPRIAKETGVYGKVFISNQSPFRHPDYKRLIWELNPYVDGFCDEHGFHPFFSDLDGSMNLLDKLMLLCGLEDGKRFHDPELYFKPEIIPELLNKTIFDPNFVSNVGKLSSGVIEEYFRENKVNVDLQMKLRDKSYPVKSYGEYMESFSLEYFCGIIISCKKLYCLASGTATLAAALGKPAFVFSGKDQAAMFRHSKLHSYIIK
jgi:FkbM family methyltransferase